MFITCFGDPAVPAARELVDIPVVGGFEPAISTVLNLGERFSVVTVLENVVPMISGWPPEWESSAAWHRLR